jgi:hypothetical protein
MLGCKPGVPVVDTNPAPRDLRGTISGQVVGPEGTSPMADRTIRVHAVDTGQVYQVRTNEAGGYSIQLPPGRYRLDLVLLKGEQVMKQPGEISLEGAELSTDQDFVVEGSSSVTLHIVSYPPHAVP